MTVLKNLPSLIGTFFTIFGCLLGVYAQENIDTGSLLGNLENVVGNYQGEIRLQSSDGLTNRVIVPHALLSLGISGDELILKTRSDLLGKECKSSLMSIREVIKYPSDENEVLRASFDFNSGQCFTQAKFQSLLVLLRKDSSQGLILETLITSNPAPLEIRDHLDQKHLVHGYFLKENSSKASPG